VCGITSETVSEVASPISRIATEPVYLSAAAFTALATEQPARRHARTGYDAALHAFQKSARKLGLDHLDLLLLRLAVTPTRRP
jgi:aryl-alcohol dehydrogenase-like predicted oxidoreductase